MDTPIQQQICARLWLIGKGLEINSWRHSGNVGQVRMTVPRRERDVITSVHVALQQGQRLRGGTAIEGRHYWRREGTTIRQRQRVTMIMDEVELVGPRTEMRDVQALPGLWIEGRVCGTRRRADGS